MTPTAGADLVGPADKNHGLTRAIRSAPWRAFLALTVFYVVAVAALSHLKLLWLDELITLHVARLGSVAAIWHALGMGADPNPPVTHILVHFSRSVFGEREFALRLPAMVGYWIGLVSLFSYLRHRVPAEWALAGTVLSMSMAAFDYSVESRSYGIFYGLAMLAFLSWSNAVDATRRRSSRNTWLVAMIAALSVGISTNYFAVLAFLPVITGELTRILLLTKKGRQGDRTHLLRSIDWRVWLAFALAISPMFVYFPLINQAISQFAPHAWNKVSMDQVFDSYTQMVESILYPLLALFAVAGMKRLLLSAKSREHRSLAAARMQRDHAARLLPVHESVGIFCFMLYPFLGYVMASLRGGMLSPRLVIPVCFGFAMAGTVTLYRLVGRSRIAGPVFLCFVLTWFAARESFVGYQYSEQRECFSKVVDRLPLAFAGLPTHTPLAVPDPLMALTFQHYAPAAYVSRMVFPVDFPAIRKFRNEDSPEQNIWAARSLYSLPIVLLATFQASTGTYVILASNYNWLLQDLDRHRYAEHRLPIDTRAAAIGGFTPLSHGEPSFFIANGGAAATGPLAPEGKPVPFRLEDNLPGAPDLVDTKPNP